MRQLTAAAPLVSLAVCGRLLGDGMVRFVNRVRTAIRKVDPTAPASSPQKLALGRPVTASAAAVAAAANAVDGNPGTIWNSGADAPPWTVSGPSWVSWREVEVLPG